MLLAHCVWGERGEGTAASHVLRGRKSDVLQATRAHLRREQLSAVAEEGMGAGVSRVASVVRCRSSCGTHVARAWSVHCTCAHSGSSVEGTLCPGLARVSSGGRRAPRRGRTRVYGRTISILQRKARVVGRTTLLYRRMKHRFARKMVTTARTMRIFRRGMSSGRRSTRVFLRKTRFFRRANRCIGTNGVNLRAEDARWTTTNDDGSREDGRLTKEDDELPTGRWPSYELKRVFVCEKMRVVRDGVSVFREKMASLRFAMAFVRWKGAFVCMKMRAARVVGEDLPTEDDELRRNRMRWHFWLLPTSNAEGCQAKRREHVGGPVRGARKGVLGAGPPQSTQFGDLAGR